jgi:hypothetical protein
MSNIFEEGKFKKALLAMLKNNRNNALADDLSRCNITLKSFGNPYLVRGMRCPWDSEGLDVQIHTSIDNISMFSESDKRVISIYSEALFPEGYVLGNINIIPLLDEDVSMVLDTVVTQTMVEFNEQYVHELWQKALERREEDPEGAVTASRSLLEATCKHILDKSGLSSQYNENTKLKHLYNSVAELLNLAPSQHTEQLFKQILEGCKSVVEGLAAIRNKASDAHGRGIGEAKPASRHAALCVNIAGTMATFLIQTWECKQAR